MNNKDSGSACDDASDDTRHQVEREPAEVPGYRIRHGTRFEVDHVDARPCQKAEFLLGRGACHTG